MCAAGGAERGQRPRVQREAARPSSRLIARRLTQPRCSPTNIRVSQSRSLPFMLRARKHWRSESNPPAIKELVRCGWILRFYSAEPAAAQQHCDRSAGKNTLDGATLLQLARHPPPKAEKSRVFTFCCCVLELDNLRHTFKRAVNDGSIQQPSENNSVPPTQPEKPKRARENPFASDDLVSVHPRKVCCQAPELDGLDMPPFP